MPKRKTSKGAIVITTPFAGFSQWFKLEVQNMHNWNPAQGSWNIDGTVYNFNNQDRIQFTSTGILVRCPNPMLHIRRGLAINMGHGRIEVS